MISVNIWLVYGECIMTTRQVARGLTYRTPTNPKTGRVSTGFIRAQVTHVSDPILEYLI